MSSITLIGYDLTKCYVLVLLCLLLSLSLLCVCVCGCIYCGSVLWLLSQFKKKKKLSLIWTYLCLFGEDACGFVGKHQCGKGKTVEDSKPAGRKKPLKENDFGTGSVYSPACPFAPCLDYDILVLID